MDVVIANVTVEGPTSGPELTSAFAQKYDNAYVGYYGMLASGKFTF